MRLLVVLALACRTTAAAESPMEETPRSKMRLDGDPATSMDRIRGNAIASKCALEERSNGTRVRCGDVEVWLVPDERGIEITCTGIPASCGKRTRALLK